jgi:DNA-binding GntR family transcriptional regulator
MVFHLNLSVASTQPTNYLLQVEIMQLDTFYSIKADKRPKVTKNCEDCIQLGQAEPNVSQLTTTNLTKTKLLFLDPRRKSLEEKDRGSSEKIAHELRAQILAGTIAPGSRILQEQLAAEFGASRLPVRDALRRLQADGLVSIVANTGAWVSKLSKKECEEAYQIRERLEPLLLRQSTQQMQPETTAALLKLVEQMEASVDVETFLRLDREFHLLAYSHGPDGMLKDLVVRLWNTTQHYRRAFVKLSGIAAGSVTHLEHRLILDAMVRGDLDDLEINLAAHIRRTRNALVAHPEIFD